MSDVAYRIRIKGLVQGVGFRPFIYRIANEFGLNGWVENRNDGVFIKVEGKKKILDNFIKRIQSDAPLASNIKSINVEDINLEHFDSFKIQNSRTSSNEITEISPDIAVCQDCLNDINCQENRINYPFTNCTNCGPRFTIIKDLPYDRKLTTMDPFPMCQKCNDEYTTILDRRFHAQPVACSKCGPYYTLFYKNKKTTKIDEIINNCCSIISNNGTIAIKGLGGYFLACDALSETAVQKLRKSKKREGKPFAVMFKNIEELNKYTKISKEEEKNLTSWRRPIVLLESKKQLADSVALGFNSIGVMLPYMPIHHMLFEKLKTPAVVLTSGNISDEPIVISNDEAENKLLGISDALLSYNREIYNRTDDSIVISINNKERIIRRSRGYVPNPIWLNMDVEGVFAVGAELVNCFCIGKGKQAILSQHIGDIKNIETYEFFTETITKYKKLFNFQPSIIVSDMHPDYLSTKYAVETNLKHIKVQHHHAHIASCMAENDLDENVIGVSFDGTGYGDDNNIWGGEFFICDLEKYNRVSHFDYVPTPGGDKVTSEPWRMAVSYLYKIYGRDFVSFDLPFLKNIEPANIELICSAIDKKINSPLSSSAGRLFDAISAILNLCTYSKFHAEAPMRLESIIDKEVKTQYSYSINKTISFNQTIEDIIKDLKADTPISLISTKFHNTIVTLINEVATDLRNKYNINKVVLSGGTFQNKYLLEQTENLLLKNKFEVYSHQKIPTNDGGIALGQLAIASKIRNTKDF